MTRASTSMQPRHYCRGEETVPRNVHNILQNTKTPLAAPVGSQPMTFSLTGVRYDQVGWRFMLCDGSGRA
jgi:hypothetical protein